MKHEQAWRPGKYVIRGGRLRSSTDPAEVGKGSRLITDQVARVYDKHLPIYARGRLLDLGCGKVPLYEAYRGRASSIFCVDWAPTAPVDHLDLCCDLAQPLPLPSASYDTIILSDVLEHIPEPALLFSEIARLLAPGGRLMMNVPFFYWLHAHPHDYYRYTEFALVRFVQLNELQLRTLQPLGGVLEVLADLVAKLLDKLPVLGGALAVAVQRAVSMFGRTPWGARIALNSARHIPLGYFLVAEKPASP